MDLADAAEPPTVLASLAATVSATASTLTVGPLEGRNIHPNGEINVDAEVMRVATVIGDVIGVLRGQAGSTAAPHVIGTDVTDHGAQLAPTVTDSALIAPFCVGTLHVVPDEFTLFPGVAGPFGGEMKPLCDAKLVNLREGQQAAPDFHLLTDAPKAGHIYGFVLDDTTNETDPNAPTFGEKYAPPFISVSIRDWQGREVTRTYTDQYGTYNALVPSTYTIQVPQPSGVAPSVLSACINSPTMPGPGGTQVPDPHFQKQYSHFCYPLQYLPGKTTYLDTPVVPTGAFTGNGTKPVDAEFPDKTPVIALVTGPTPAPNPPAPSPTAPYGPYIVDRGAGDNASRTILIQSAGNTQVANPNYDGAAGTQPKLIARDYGFGSSGTVRIGGTAIPAANVTWGNDQITAIVPPGTRTGQLTVERGGAQVCPPPTLAALSTLAAGIGAANGTLVVAPGDGKKFTSPSQIQIDSEVMQVTGGNRSTLALPMTTTLTGPLAIGGTTLRVPNNAGSLVATLPFPLYVSVDNEVIRLDSRSSTLTTGNIAASGALITFSVTPGTGSARFLTGDLINVGTEPMTVLVAAANSLTVMRSAPVAHLSGSPVTANDRFGVTRAQAGTTIASHSVSAAVIGDQLAVTRAQAGTTAATHVAGAVVNSYAQGPCTTTGSIKSVLGVTLSVATPQMHSARPPKTVGGAGSAFSTIQAAMDAAITGDLVLVRPGVYEEMVIMKRPVRLQGTGALSTTINVVTPPAERIQDWLDTMGNLLLSTPGYLLPNQPAMTPPPFFSGDVGALVGDEGPGVMVLGNGTFTPASGGTGAEIGTCRRNNNGNALLYQNFVTRPNGYEAYCRQNENYTGSASTPALYLPNARIDGLSLVGASNAPGVLVNGYAHYLEISNNKIHTNSGTFAGGIQLGHPGAPAPFDDDNAQNDNVAIHNNMVIQNASVETGGGGGIVLGAGSTSYSVTRNWVAANLSSGNGGGISHVGLSPLGVIDANTVVFNESFTQAAGTNGGGIFIGGTPPAAGALTPGSGTVEVRNNLIQGNGATGGDGGGVALQGVNGADLSLNQNQRYRVRLYNNVIANNVAGLAGGGLSIVDAAYVDVTHNTIVHNDSTGTAMGAFTGPLTSEPQPAGVVVRGFTWGNALTGSPVANVTIANSIIWQNRTFRFGPTTALPFCGDTVPPNTPPCSIVPPPPPPPGPSPATPTQYGEIQIAARPYWDVAVLGSSSQFTASSLRSTVLTQLNGPSNAANYVSGTNNVNYNVANNTNTPPVFAASYFNGDRRQAATDLFSLIATPAALDEGGNFIRPQFGPLSLGDALGVFHGNYHVTTGENGQALCGSGGSLYGGACSGTHFWDALLTDFDQNPRPTGAPDRGADEFLSPAPTTPVPQR
jgi:hypothetical protein